MKYSAPYPRLVVDGAARAVAFYTMAMGARAGERFTGPDGRIVHVELAIGDGRVAVKDEGDGDPAPTTLGGTPVILVLPVTNADAVGALMVSLGATVVYPIADQPYGVREGRLRDPFGHLWIVTQIPA